MVIYNGVDYMVANLAQVFNEFFKVKPRAQVNLTNHLIDCSIYFVSSAHMYRWNLLFILQIKQ